jgi:hypothetical protein
MPAQTHVNVTPREKAVLRAVYHNWFQNASGRETIENPIWSHLINDSAEPAEFGLGLAGIVGSLCRKGLLASDRDRVVAGKLKQKDRCVWLTREGYHVAIH